MAAALLLLSAVSDGGCCASSMVLNAFWKTQTDNYFIRMGPLGPLIHSQLWVLLILSEYRPLTVQS